MAAVHTINQLDSLDNFTQMIESIIVNKTTLLETINLLLNNSFISNLDEYIKVLVPYVKRYNLSKTSLLRLSHIFCESCLLYKPSYLCGWASENQELFDTEIFVFNKFFTMFPSLNKNISTYPLEHLFMSNDTPIVEQTRFEKLKTLNSVITYYDYIKNYDL